MTLVLTNDDARQVLTMGDALSALESLYQDLGHGRAVYRGRTDLFIPTSADTGLEAPAAYQLKTLDGAVPRLQAGSIRVTSDVVAFPIVNGQRRRIKVAAARGERYVGLVFLFSSATGELVSVLQDGYLQQLSVGAINGIAASHLARANASTVALFGAGGQAGPQLLGLREVRPMRRVRVYTPSPGEAEAFAKKHAAAMGLEMTAARSPEAALEGADIVVTATNSRVPFFPAAWLEPGMHLSCLQRDEAMDDCFTELDIVVFHTHAKELEYASTDFAEMERRHEFKMRDHPERDLDWRAFPDLGQLVTGRTAGRANEEQRTFFLNSTGVGAQYTAVAHHVYTRAKEKGLGHEVPAEWFVQAVG
jgi:ornithine cyclodeaminase/alanine dehydrogenase-like protein (mu-crystallin family)